MGAAGFNQSGALETTHRHDDRCGPECYVAPTSETQPAEVLAYRQDLSRARTLAGQLVTTLLDAATSARCAGDLDAAVAFVRLEEQAVEVYVGLREFQDGRS